MIWTTLAAGIFGGWVLLLILGSERQRRLDDLARRLAREAEEAAEKARQPG